MSKKWSKMLTIGIIAIWAISSAAAGTWETKAPAPTARRAPAGVKVNDEIYAVGGCGGQGRKNEKYNPATNSWETKASLSQPRRRGLGGVAAEFNGRVYLIGGHQGPPPGQTVNFNDEYDPGTNSWTIKASMPTATEGAALGVVGGKAYVIGGYSGTAFLNAVQEYDPGTNSWATKALMPTARGFVTAAVVEGKIYVVGGFDGASCLDVVEMYDPVANSWSAKAPMPTARYWLAAAAVSGKVYALGGFDGANWLATNEVYDPAANSWSTDADMPTSRSHLAAVEANGKIYAIGGVVAGGSFTNANEEFTPSSGIEEEAGRAAFAGMETYPNPFRSACRIVTPAGALVEIAGRDGRVVHRAGSTGELIWRPSRQISSGVYFVRTTSEGRTAVTRLVYLD